MGEKKEDNIEIEDGLRYHCGGCSTSVYFDFRVGGLETLKEGSFGGLSLSELTVGGKIGKADFELSITPCPQCGEAGKLCLEDVSLKVSASF
jgi:hypothetical protein